MHQFALEVLILVCLMLTGANTPKPIGWVVLGFSALGFVFLLFTGLPK